MTTTLGWSPTWTTTPAPPERWCSAPTPPAGNMLELVVVHFDDARDTVIHAMPMRRRQYESLLAPQEPLT